MKNRFNIFILIIVGFLIGTTIYPQVYLKARLTPEQIRSSKDTAKSNFIGTGAFILSNNEVNYIITVTTGNKNDTTSFKDSTGVIRSVTIHMGAIGDSGNVVATLSDSAKKNTIAGVWTSTGPNPLTNNLQQELVQGKMYVLVTTKKGSVRGQIEPASGTGFIAHLTGPQEGDSIKTNASGTGSFLLADNIGLVYLITVRNINISAAHFHMALPGVPGGIVKPISFSGHTAMGIWTPNDANPFSTEMKKALLVENLYVNVHSPQFPAGEIRGQVLHAGGFGFSSPLTSSRTGVKDTSKTRRIVSGNASYTLTDAGLVIHINVNSPDNISKVYFASLGGQSIRNIDSVKRSGTFSDVWFTNKNDETNSLTDQNISDLLKGNLSLVVQTTKDTLMGRIKLNKETNFTAMLTGQQEGSKVKSNASGLGHFTLRNNTLSYYITVTGIDTISASHFHFAEPGVPGAVVHPISFDSNHVASGTWNVSDSTGNSMLNNLLEGKLYVNVHSPKYPAGEIRGQILLSSGTDFTANLTGSQETPQVKSTTMGTGNFILTNEGLVYKITLDSLTIAASHFHLGIIGVAGNVVKAITPDFTDSTGGSGGTAVGIWKRTGDTQPLTDSLLNALLAGYIYVNVHTAANPGGEIRGQLLPNGGTGFVTVFDTSKNTTTPNIQNALGNAVFTLTDAGLLYNLSVNVKNISSASINIGQAGQQGSIVQDITKNFQGMSAKGTWLMLNDSTSANNLSALYTNGLSLNFKAGGLTPGNLGGTISRGFKGTLTSVTETKQVPKQFTLEQNYPNPFNPNTQIKFTIPAKGMVNLTIFNILGEKVATLINDQLNTGNYVVTFNGSNLASGVYFYRLIFENNITTKKMMLLK